MAHKIEVFTSPTCPHCPGAVKVVEEAKAIIDGCTFTNNQAISVGSPSYVSVGGGNIAMTSLVTSNDNTCIVSQIPDTAIFQ